MIVISGNWAASRIIAALLCPLGFSFLQSLASIIAVFFVRLRRVEKAGRTAGVGIHYGWTLRFLGRCAETCNPIPLTPLYAIPRIHAGSLCLRKQCQHIVAPVVD